MLADWDAETADDAEMGNIDDIYENLDADYAKRQQEKANAEADYLNDPQGDETKSLVSTIAAEEKAAANLKALDFTGKKPQIVIDKDVVNPEMSMAVEVDKPLMSMANWGKTELQNLDKAVHVPVGNDNAKIKDVKKAVSQGDPFTADSMTARANKLMKEADDIYKTDPDWGIAMMQFGLALMSTPGPFLSAVGKAGQSALKTYQDSKKNHFNRAEKKEELALKWSKLADDKKTAASDAKEKMYTKWEVNKDGTISTSQVVGKKTGKERASQIVNEMDSVYAKGKLGNLTEKQAVRFANDYVTAFNQTSEFSDTLGFTNLSGKVNPMEVFKELRGKFGANKSLARAETSFLSSIPVGKRKREYSQKIGATKGLLRNVADYHNLIDKMDPTAANWYGALYKKAKGAVQPFFDSVALEEGTTKSSMESTAKATFESITKIKLNPNSKSDIDVENTEMFTMAYGLARQIMKVGYDEQGRSLSDKDMDFAMTMIAPGFGSTATKATMKTAIDAAMRSLSNSQFERYAELFPNPDKTTEALKTEYLSGFEKKHAQYLAGIHGKDWTDALPTSYRDSTTAGTPTPTPTINTKASFVPGSGYTLNGRVLYKDDTALTSGLIQMRQRLLAKYKGDSAKAFRELTNYIHKNFDAELVPSILQKVR
jgi:hypothetical protein